MGRGGVYVPVTVGAEGLEGRGRSGRVDGKEGPGACRGHIRGCKGAGGRTKVVREEGGGGGMERKGLRSHFG